MENKKKLTNESVHDETLKSLLAGKITAIPNLEEEVTRQIVPSYLLYQAAKDTAAKASAVLKGGYNNAKVEDGVLETYYVDALRLRIKCVLDPAGLTFDERSRQENYPLPSVVYNAIRQVGVATDLVHHVRYVPEMHPAFGEELELDYATFLKCRRLLEAVSAQSDFVTSVALNGEKTGDLYLMAMDNDMPESTANYLETFYRLTDETEKEWHPEVKAKLFEGHAVWSQKRQATMLDSHIVTGFYSAFFYKSARTGKYANVSIETHSSVFENINTLNTILYVDGSTKTMTEVVNELSV